MKQGEVKEKYKILIANDERVVQDLFSRFLSQKGYEIFPAGNDKEALDR